MAQSTTKTPTSVPPAAAQQPKKVSHTASITGCILAVLSLVSTGIAHFLIHMKYTPTGPTTGSTEAEVGHAVATGTTSVLGALLGVPFLVGGLVLGFIAAIFIIFRLHKVRLGGAIFSVIAAALIVWSVSIVISDFDYIKAKPALDQTGSVKTR